MSNLTPAQRDKLPDSAFCGPNRTFPVLDASDVKAAATLLGKESPAVQEQIKECAMRKARRFGWPIPESWKQ